ncbi:hypothetical protein BJV74DRAFT_775672, partial [Russula compacta]
ILIDSSLSNAQLDKLLKLINHCIDGKGTLMLSRHADLQAAWDHASLKLTPFKQSTMSVQYKGEQRSFDVIYCPLWDWATDLI